MTVAGECQATLGQLGIAEALLYKQTRSLNLGLHEGPDPRNLGSRNTLHKFYFRTRNWSQAGSLVPENRRSIFLRGDQRD